MSNRLYVKVKLEAYWYILQIQVLVKDLMVNERDLVCWLGTTWYV